MEKNLTNIIKYSPSQTRDMILDKLNPKTKFVLDYQNLDTLIEDALTILNASKLNLIKIKKIENLPRDFETINKIIRAGFLPKDRLNALNDYYLLGFSKDEIHMWGRQTVENLTDIDKISIIIQKKEWVYANIEGWKKFSIDNGDSFPLVLYANFLLYKSMRPKTDMLIFKNPTSKTYTSKKRLTDNYSFILNDNIRAIPVTRYSKGMSRGLFYKNQKDTKYCGTFYYYEPESTTLLSYKTSAIYRNKYEAMKDMDLKYAEDFMHSNRFLLTVVKYYKNPDLFPTDLKMTYKEYVELVYRLDSYDDEIRMLYKGKIEGEDIIKAEKYWRNLAEDKKKYVGRELNLYALEDDLDQPLCNAARSKGIDVIILTDMIGSMQIVTEILDTRDKISRFSDLYYPKH